MGAHGWSHLASTYDAVAADYAAAFSDELAGKPFDRRALDELASRVGRAGPVADLGCGPAQVADHLALRGCEVIGIDLSPAMLAAARYRQPGLPVAAGDLRALPLPDTSCGAITCFYALIHLPRAEVPGALAEMHRVLRPGGQLLLAVHGGAGEVHVDGWFGRDVAFDATLFDDAELAALVAAAELDEVRVTRREPYPSEHPTPRLYVTAGRPGG